MAELPSGTVTFLFTDIERSTESAAALGDERYAEALQIHRDLLRPAFENHGGVEVGTEGDAFFVAFARAGDAVNAAVGGQLAVESHVWPGETRLRVRMGLHTGEALVRAGDYVGHDVHKAKRVSDAGHGGQIVLSQTTADLVRDGTALVDLGPHRLKDLSEPQRLYQVEAEGLPSTFPRLRTLEAAPHNLPIQLTSFVGRERELGEVNALIFATRLLTITGAGGCGKTRLAVQLGAELLDEFPNGVWLADLAPITDEAVVPQAVADAAGVPQGHGEDIMVQADAEERLVAHLNGRRALVILDNCEHLIGACAALVTTLLRKAAEVRVIVTTREPLGVAGETSWRLPSLTVPSGATPEELMGAESTRLFCERAAQAVPSFAPSHDDARAIVDICTRLDGIPLAIELAAARVRVLSCADISKRLDDRFRLLTGGSRTAMPRQQTLRATVDWSYDLLSTDQQTLLRRLSVFAGGFTLDSVEHICGDEALPADDMLDHLTALVDRSLVLALQSEGHARYRTLDTVRHYAREKLLDSRESNELRRRHMDHFAELVEHGASRLHGPAFRTWLDTFEAELANIRQAFDWALTEEPALALQIAGSLYEFWISSVRGNEGPRWAEAALAVTENTPSRARARALRTAAMWRAGDESAGAHSEAMEMARAIDDRETIALMLTNRANYLNVIGGDREKSRALAEEALALSREIGDDWITARSLRLLSVAVAREGDIDRARDLLQQSLKVAATVGDPHEQALVEGALGNFARFERDWRSAREHLERQLELARENGCRNCLGGAQIILAWLARGRGDHREATELAGNSMRIAYEDRVEGLLYFSVGTFAMIAFDTGDHERAARLFGAHDRLRAALGTLGGDPAAAERRRMNQVRDALGDDAFDTAFEAGKRMTLDQAVAYALEGADG